MLLLDKDIKSLQSNFTQILTSGCHYNTPELSNHIKRINNALDNIKLDYEFQRGSKTLAKQFAANDTKFDETKIEELVSQGKELSQQLNLKLHLVSLKSKEYNQLCEIHSWACDSLDDYLRSLSPYASGSYSRLDNIAHLLGVTDRYVGYRNNLTRYANQPVNVHTIWADRKFPETATPDWKDFTYSFQHNATSPTPYEKPSIHKEKIIERSTTPEPKDFSYESQRLNTRKKVKSQSFFCATDYNTHLTKAGINFDYPGKTETAQRFTKLKELSRSPSLAVAQADYTTIGRPLSRLIAEPKHTEYTMSYAFPDESKIERYPYFRP